MMIFNEVDKHAERREQYQIAFQGLSQAQIDSKIEAIVIDHGKIKNNKFDQVCETMLALLQLKDEFLDHVECLSILHSNPSQVFKIAAETELASKKHTHEIFGHKIQVNSHLYQTLRRKEQTPRLTPANNTQTAITHPQPE